MIAVAPSPVLPLDLGTTLGGTAFTLPVELVTQAIGILAKRRAGKSYTAAKLVEQLLHAGEQVVIADPKGDWWGLRSSADGQRPGFPILILGGEHGDLPLEAHAGEVIAQLVVDERISVLLDLSAFRKHEVASFMTGFLETLYRLKAQERYRTAMLLMIDEADAIAPQKPQKGEERMLGAAEDIVRRGGQRGIGCAMVTQRAAVLNKNVLTQIEVLVALRTIAPQDLAAVGDWIDVHGTPDERKELMQSLPALPVGTAWVWSPGWPTDAGIFERVKVGERETFDSGATPKSGEARREPRTLADVDLGVLKERMAATIERAKADDPKELRRRIAELERQLAQRSAQTRVETVIERVEVPVVPAADLAQLVAYGQEMQRTGRDMITIGERVLAALDQVQAQPAPAVKPAAPAVKATYQDLPKRTELVDRSTTRAASNGQTDAKLGLAERKILTVLAQYPQGRTKVQVALLAGYSVRGGGFQNALGSLRSKGYIVGSQDLQATEAGLTALGTWESLPTGTALVEYWYTQLGKAERAILQVLVAATGHAMTKQQVADAAGYEVTGGGFNNALGKLRTLELIEGRSEVRASATLTE